MLSLYRQFSKELSSSILSAWNLWHLVPQINKTYNMLKMAISWIRKNLLLLTSRRVKHHHSVAMILLLQRMQISLGVHCVTKYSDKKTYWVSTSVCNNRTAHQPMTNTITTFQFTCKVNPISDCKHDLTRCMHVVIHEEYHANYYFIWWGFRREMLLVISKIVWLERKIWWNILNPI